MLERKDNKKRFDLLEENGELLIRANQGHTIQTVETESLLKPILSAEEIPVCVHGIGTYKKFLGSILEQGLKRMERLHIHFASGVPSDGEVISALRRNINAQIYLNTRKALEEGTKPYMSDNKVILAEGIDRTVRPSTLRELNHGRTDNLYLFRYGIYAQRLAVSFSSNIGIVRI